jgi:isopenicillin N synthase-like dioxygenase
MPSAVSNKPAFVPSEKELAELRTVKFSLLLDQDKRELSKLLAAAEEVGFFYLDLTDDASRDLLETLDELKSVMADWFAQPEAIKMKTPLVTKAHGYKALGTHAGVGGQRDGWEALKAGPPIVSSVEHC